MKRLSPYDSASQHLTQRSIILFFVGDICSFIQHVSLGNFLFARTEDHMVRKRFLKIKILCHHKAYRWDRKILHYCPIVLGFPPSNREPMKIRIQWVLPGQSTEAHEILKAGC